jgi:hypothetical protein
MRGRDDAWREFHEERKQRKGRRRAPKAKAQLTPREDQRAIKDFVATRTGVEAFVEPRTLAQEFSVVLVATDGEWLRFHLPDDSWLLKFAHKHGVPVYDAGVLGYPKRMKDYRRGQAD